MDPRWRGCLPPHPNRGSPEPRFVSSSCTCRLCRGDDSQAVLERTAAAEGVAATCDEKTAAAWAARELRLIQSQADILDPPAAFLPSAVDLLG